MKHHFILEKLVFAFGLLTATLFVSPVQAASVSLATEPLASSTTTTVKPNVLFVLDDSGSMSWDHMPDDNSDNGSSVTWEYGYYGMRSNQCNQVYYDPTFTYSTPVNDALPPVPYSNATFTAAWTNGFNTGSGTVNLNTNYKANQSGIGGNAGGSDANGGAYYYRYSGIQSTQLQKDYNSTSNTFFNECNSALGAAPGNGVFSKRRLASTETTTIVLAGGGSGSGTQVNSITVGSTTITSGATTQTNNINTLAGLIQAKITLSGYSATVSGSTVTITGPTSAKDLPPVITLGAAAGTAITFTTDVFPDTTAANLTNFANWYSYYRTRMLMMKTAAGQAFSTLNNNYRVGLLRLSSSSAPAVELGTFETAKRTDWYNTFYGITPGGSTPLRVALSDAGRYYAGLLGSSVTDPMQYSCQQNFSIMSTDGYWNGGSGYQLDGSTAIGNQDDTSGRPSYDGATTSSSWTYVYTRDFYSRVTPSPNFCGFGGKVLKTQPQIGSCTATSGTSSCTPGSWSNTGLAVLGTTCYVPATAPLPTAAALDNVSQNTTGGASNTLADVAMYYYQTDLRTDVLNNCNGAITGELLCSTPVAPETEDPYNNVFKSSSDSNTKQHMTTFTLGLGASGRMRYSAGYAKSGTNADYDAVRLGTSAAPAAATPVCPWQAAGTSCNWPLPGLSGGGDGLIANIDDLWHAAVNGRGTYFSATNPDTLSTGLSNALAGINAKKGSAAAAATSTLNPVAGNNFAYVASFTTVEWKGNLEARGINTDTGVVNETASWCVEDVSVSPDAAATCTSSGGSIVSQTSGDVTVSNCEKPVSSGCSAGIVECSGNTTSCLPAAEVCKVQLPSGCTGTMNSKVAVLTDTRNIKTANSAGTALIAFDAAYAAANLSYFNTSVLGGLSQWTTLDTAQQGRAANGTNLINYLRGQSGFENRPTNVTGSGPTLVDNQLFRARTAVVGDALESQPAFLGPPVFSYPYPGYTAFKTGTAASRRGMVYMGTNDGMLHAFYAKDVTSPCTVGSGSTCGGDEAWAYVPSMVVPNMWKLASFDYSTSHRNFVNGSPITSDICAGTIAECAVSATAATKWKTILVAGLNGGGRGYYALDITNPTAPTLLWEFTTTAGIGKIQDADLGYSYGQPVITKKADGTWVVLVTSGYNNTSPGDGKGYLYVLNAATGAIISKVSTGVGTTTTPSGFAKIAGWNNEPPGNAASYVYGGDLQGNVWRFDINTCTATSPINTCNVIKFAKLYSNAATTDSSVPTSGDQSIMTTPVLGQIAGNRVVYIGTGKYLETGDLTTTQQQTQYAIKDDNSGATFINPRTQTTLMVQQTMVLNAAGSGRTMTSATPAPNFSTGRGWFVNFLESGERVNIDSQLVQGVLLVPSIVPSNTACSPGGHGWLNFLDYKTGAAVTSSGLVSAKYDSTIVGVNVLYIDGNPVVEVVTSTDPTPKKDEDVPFPPIAGSFTGKRTLWRELVQ